MPGIVTITFSPCIDRSANVASLIPDKKLNCTKYKLEPGGGGINVARAIKKLGGDAIAIYPAGGYTGMYFNNILSDENIATISITTIRETREKNVIILDESNNRQYRFGMPANTLDVREWKHMLKAVSDLNDVKFLVASGSLPPGVPCDIFAQLARIAKAKGIKLVVDTSGEPLQNAVQEGIYLLKPNLAELSSLVGMKILSDNDVVRSSQQLVKSGKVKVIVVSMGEKGAFMITENRQLLLTPPSVQKQSTVGAGDSMVAGIVYALSQGMKIDEASAYGVACGTAATLNPGTELCKKDDADRLFAQIITLSSFE